MGDIVNSEDKASSLDMETAENVGDPGNKVVIHADSLADPRVLEAVKAKIKMFNANIELPKEVKRRVKALKKLQLEHVQAEAQFYIELEQLAQKYDTQFMPLYEKRRQIVNGQVEPTDEECDFTLDDDEESELADGVEKVKLEEDDVANKEEKGIPNFWLIALKNAPIIADIIEEYDEPILKHLTDIKAITELSPLSFVLEFHFEPNEFFSNVILSKQYMLKCVPDPTDPFSFDGPEIVKCKGCRIDWKSGKNVTVKRIKKKQKHKSHGAVRVVMKTVQNESFFNFFNPPAVPESENNVDEDIRTTLTTDFEIGNSIKDQVIPRAVIYFTGENMIDEEFDEEEDEEDEEEELDEEEDSDEDNEGGHLVKKGSPNSKQNPPPECKQQ